MDWQKRMRGKDHQQKMAEIEKKRMEGKISHEEAILARQKQTEINQRKVIIDKLIIGQYWESIILT